MSLIDKRINANFSRIIWHADEELSYLIDNIILNDEEKIIFARITNENRQREWLTVRYIIQNELNILNHIIYTKNGKPTLPNLNISISHSKQMIAVLISKYPCSIDIEQVGIRVAKIAHKAFNNNELTFASNNILLTILWCTKETVFKLYGEGSIDFKTDMTVLPFENHNEGTIRCQFHKNNLLIESLQLESINDFKIVWIVDKNNQFHDI